MKWVLMLKVVVPTSYEIIIEGMRFGHIDAAFMDTGPAWITHQRTGAEAVLAELVNGKVNYQATVWTLADNDSINSLEDTVGKKSGIYQHYWLIRFCKTYGNFGS